MVSNLKVHSSSLQLTISTSQAPSKKAGKKVAATQKKGGTSTGATKFVKVRNCNYIYLKVELIWYTRRTGRRVSRRSKLACPI